MATVRRSSSAAASGSAVGSAAKPASRSGWRCTASAKRVVRDACEWDRLSRVELLHSWSGQRQNLDIDTGGVHVRDPALANIAELVDQPGKSGRDLRVRPDCFGLFFDLAAGTIHERGRRVMLFKVMVRISYLPFPAVLIWQPRSTTYALYSGAGAAVGIRASCHFRFRQGSLGCLVVHQARAGVAIWIE